MSRVYATKELEQRAARKRLSDRVRRCITEMNYVATGMSEVFPLWDSVDENVRVEYGAAFLRLYEAFKTLRDKH
jgi:hypothetical protein